MAASLSAGRMGFGFGLLATVGRDPFVGGSAVALLVKVWGEPFGSGSAGLLLGAASGVAVLENLSKRWPIKTLMSSFYVSEYAVFRRFTGSYFVC